MKALGRAILALGVVCAASAWAADPAPEPLLVNQIAAAPSDPNVLYAASRPDGMLKSVDRGRTWRPARTGILNTSAYHVAVHPEDASIAYVGTFGGGVYRTPDGGRSWVGVNTGLGNSNIHAMYLDAKRPERLVVSTSTGDVYATQNGGGRWVPYGQGLPSMDGEVLSSFLAVQDGLWLGQGTLYLRPSSGDAWRKIGQDVSEAAITSLAVDRAGRVFAGTRRRGILSSADRGRTWSSASSTFDGVWIRLVVADAAGRLWTSALRKGLFRSDDGGRTWSKVGVGLPDKDDVETLVVDAGEPERVYVGTHDHGLFLSTDGGGTFSPPESVVREGVQQVIASLIGRDPSSARRGGSPTPPAAFRKCSGCHGWTDPVLSEKATYWRVTANERDWGPTVARMAPGAGLSAEEQRVVTEFLTTYTSAR